MADNTEKTDQKSSFGRNIFMEKRSKLTETKNSEIVEILELKPSKTVDLIEITEDKSASPKPSLKKSSKASQSKSAPVAQSLNNNIIALYVTETHSVLVATFYDGLCYTVNKVEIEPVEAPLLTDENIMKANVSEIIFNNQVESIKKLFEKSGISRKDVEVVTSIGGKGTVIKQLSLDGIQMANVESELPKQLVTSFDNSTGRYEYILLNSEIVDGAVINNVLAACVDNKIFFGVQGLMASAGVKCSIMDIDVMAVVNLFLESVGPKDTDINCILDIGMDASYVIIVSPDSKEGLYVRNLDFTFSSFRKLLAQNRECSLVEAEKMLAERNFSEYFTKAFELETSENLNSLHPVKNILKRDLLTELRRTFEFYAKKANNRYPSTIYVSGKALDMKSFAQCIVKNVDVKCEELDVSGFLMGDELLKDKINLNRSIVYKAVGLALRFE